MSGPYTPPQMDAELSGGDPGAGPFDTLYAEAKSTLGYAANQMRSLAEQYRQAYREVLASWHDGRDALDESDRADLVTPADGSGPLAAAEGEAAEDALGILRRRVTLLTNELGGLQAELSRLELVVRTLERTWLFLERGDASLLSDPSEPELRGDLQMRIVEAVEAERTRLAQEVHDGPAQALSNAIFQAEYIDKVLDEDPRAVRAELRFLRERLRRELGDVRAFISQLRPPVLDELGLNGSIRDTADALAALTGATIETSLAAPAERLSDPEQTVVLRVLQEALQNVRKHAAAGHVWVTTRLEDGRWTLEVRDDGRGFDIDAVAARGRRNFGLQFMRERADLVRARFEVRSRPTSGTVVRLAVPVGREGG